MILLIARRDKCDLIFRRQLLSCFVSLRSFQKADNNYPAELSSHSPPPFSHKRRKNKTRIKQNDFCFCSLTSLSKKLFLLLEEGFVFRTLNFTIIHTRPVSQPCSTPQALILDYIHCYTKEHENKDDCYRQLHCMYNILYRETKHHFHS